MSEEEKDKDIYVINDDSKIDFEKSGNDFGIMPEEFFNSQYQQSRVRKEQQMQKEKELIDKKKKEKEERLKRLAELEKQTREKDELKKERERIKQEEKRKKQEETDFINQKRKEKEEQLKQERAKQREEQELMMKRKLEKKKKIKDIDQKAKEERKLLKKEQKELLKLELEKRAAILRSQNAGMSEDQKNKEVEKVLSTERAEILKKIKLEQKLNKKEQDRIRKELKEEEKNKLEEARKEALAKAKMEIGNASANKKSLDLDFVDDNRLSKLEIQKQKKRRILIVSYLSIGCIFVFFVLLQTKIINLNQTNVDNNTTTNIVDDYSIRLNDKALFSKEFQNLDNKLIDYNVAFNDRRDIDSINFDVMNSSNFNIETSNFGVFTFGKTEKLNKNVNVKVSGIPCDNDVYLNYFDESQNKWTMTEKLDCKDSSLTFVVKDNLFQYYSLSNSSGIKGVNEYSNYDLSLNYWYAYKFSRFVDFFKYKINDNNSNGYISTIEKNVYGATIGRTVDSDGDGYIDGEEVLNLYDPSKKDSNQSLDLKLINSKKVVLYKFSNIEFYYPALFVAPFNLQESIIISPDVNSKEFISVDVLKKDRGMAITDFINTQEASKDIYTINRFSDTIKNNFYINSIGNNAYLDIGDDNVLKISYTFDTKDSVNYVTTFLMILNSVAIVQ